MFGRRRYEDFAAEVEAHIALEADRLEREGMGKTGALAAARRAFGNQLAAEEKFYESSRAMWIEDLRRDTKYALRALRHSKAFTAAAILTLALGIGANTAIFSVIDAALLRPLPYPDPAQLVVISGRYPSGETSSLAPADFLDFRRDSRSFQNIAAYRGYPVNLTGEDRPERINGAVVTPEFFSVLRVQAQLGRALTPAEDKPGGARSVVLSHALWQRRYASDPEAIGKRIDIDGEPRTVVGVMPRFFRFPNECELWTSARFAVPEHILRPTIDLSNARDTHYFETIGRLKPGVTVQAAQSEATAIARRIARQFPEDEYADAEVVSLHEDLTGETRPALLILLGAVGLLLAVACANVANILLARGAAREKEIALRAALGARHWRLVRQLLAESVVLAAAGGCAGLLLAYAAVGPLRAMLTADVLAGSAIKIDSRVLLFTLVLSLLSGICFGLAPALSLAGADLNAVIKEGARGASTGARAQRTRGVLVVSEVALATVLLAGAVLLIRSFSQVLRAPEGFAAEHVLSLQLSLSQGRYPDPSTRALFVSQALGRIRALPGVLSAAVTSRLPLNPGNSTRSLDVKGRTPPPTGDPSPDYIVASPDFFRSMEIRIVRGREFSERDDLLSPPVVIVNQSMARHFWPNQDPIGQAVRVGGCGSDKQWCQVVGLVEDVRQHNLDLAPRPAVYVPYARDPWPFMSFVVRTATDPSAAASAVQTAIHAVDKDQPVYGVRAMRDVVSASVAPRRARTALLGLFALLALAMASAGIYGVIAYSVAQRSVEIGIRMALGAARRDVLRLVVGQGIKLAASGVAVGIALSLVVTRFLSSVLYGVQPRDATTLAAASALLFGVALLSSYLPAARAAGIDPARSLRAE